MTATYHGHWERYTPTELPEHCPAHALFWRRDDGADWYEWSRARWQIIAGVDASGVVKVTALDGVVSCVSADATSLTLGGEFDLYELEEGDTVPASGWIVADGVLVDPATIGPTIEDQLLAIEAAFAAKKAALAAQLSTVVLIGGSAQETKNTELQAAYVTACDEKASALDALLFGV